MSENSLVNKLEKEGSTLSLDNGETPLTPDFATSTLHKEYSLNDDPSKLEVRPLNGELPSATTLASGDDIAKYKDNLPAGGSL